MNQKIFCKNRQLSVVLDCQKLQKNLFKLIKILNDIGQLYIMPKPKDNKPQSPSILLEQALINHNSCPLLRSSVNIKESNKYVFSLNTAQAIQLIWRGAFLTKEIGIGEQQLRQIKVDKLIGQNNQLCDIIVSLAQHLDKVSPSQRLKPSKIVEGRKNLLHLGEIQHKIAQIWKRITQEYRPKYETINQQNKLISLLRVNLDSRERQIILTFIRSKILEIDLLLFDSSIMYIQEINEQQCLVILEQCYPSFFVNKQQLKKTIGIQSYRKGINKYQQLVKKAASKYLPFKRTLFFMCHKCYCVLFNDPRGQIYYRCKSKQNKTDFISNWYSYQQIFLYANIKVIPQLYSYKHKNQPVSGKDYVKYYVYQYLRRHHTICYRYICEECYVKQSSVNRKHTKQETKTSFTDKSLQNEMIDENLENKRIQSKINTQKVLKNPCQFCQGTCCCRRCTMADTLNKFIAFYDSFGGSVEQLIEKFIFANEKNEKIVMHAIRQEQPIRQNSKKTSRHGLESEDQEDLNSEEQHKTKQIKKTRYQIKKERREQLRRLNESKPKILFYDSQKELTNQMMRFAPLQSENSADQSIIKNCNDDFFQNPSGSSASSSDYSSSVDSNVIFPGLQNFFSQIVYEQEKQINMNSVQSGQYQ